MVWWCRLSPHLQQKTEPKVLHSASTNKCLVTCGHSLGDAGDAGDGIKDADGPDEEVVVRLQVRVDESCRRRSLGWQSRGIKKHNRENRDTETGVDTRKRDEK